MFWVCMRGRRAAPKSQTNAEPNDNQRRPRAKPALGGDP